jgi:hypothetical protein
MPKWGPAAFVAAVVTVLYATPADAQEPQPPLAAEPPAIPGGEANWRFGVSTSVALPKPINLGVHATWQRRWGVYAQAGFLPKVEYFENSFISIFGVDTEARWFPWQGAFFVGAGVGWQNTTLVYRQFRTDSAGTVNSVHATLRAGWMWTFESGLALSVDVGLQSPMIASDLSNPDKSLLVRDIYDQLKVLPLPNLSLIRVGYSF